MKKTKWSRVAVIHQTRDAVWQANTVKGYDFYKLKVKIPAGCWTIFKPLREAVASRLGIVEPVPAWPQGRKYAEVWIKV